MRLNPILVQKALTAFSNAIYFLSQAVSFDSADVKEYNEIMKARQAAANMGRAPAAPKPEKAPKPAPEPKEDLKALKEDLKAEERKMAAKEERRETISKAMSRQPAARPQKQDSGLPDKPMKQARMEEYLKEWIPRTKAHPMKSGGGYVAGMGCSYQGAEHIVKAVYSNGVFLLNRRGTQYHRLVPSDQVESLFLKGSGVQGKYAAGQKVLVCFGLKESDKATSFRQAEIVSIRGQNAQVKYLDTGNSSSASLSHLKPCAEG